VDDAVVVEAFESSEDRADDGDDVVLALCEDVVKDISASSEPNGEVVFCARLESLVKCDLRGETRRVEKKRQTMFGWSRPVRRSISVQTLTFKAGSSHIKVKTGQHWLLKN